jgi:hypothetical protein
MCHVESKLFHYTSLEGLAYILSSKSIRFSRLDKVNDVDEGASADYDEAHTMVFASCWTASEDERIELWSLYTNLRGVRIALPSDMFRISDDEDSGINNIHNRKRIAWSDLTGDQKKGLILKRRRAAGSFLHPQPNTLSYVLPEIWGPERLRYVDPAELPVRVFDQSTGTYDVSELGLKKSQVWYFEDEIRFRLMALLPDTAKKHGSRKLAVE